MTQAATAYYEMELVEKCVCIRLVKLIDSLVLPDVWRKLLV